MLHTFPSIRQPSSNIHIYNQMLMMHSHSRWLTPTTEPSGDSGEVYVFEKQQKLVRTSTKTRSHIHNMGQSHWYGANMNNMQRHTPQQGRSTTEAKSSRT